MLVAAGIGPTACAGSKASKSTDAEEWPATIPAFHEAIERERERLKDYVSRPTEGSDRSTVTPEEWIAIAERITRLQTELETLEASARASDEPNAP